MAYAVSGVEESGHTFSLPRSPLPHALTRNGRLLGLLVSMDMV